MNKKWTLIIAVAGTVIGGLIVHFVLNFNLVSLVSDIFKWIYTFFTQDFSLPLWGLVLVALIPITIIFIIYFILSKKENIPAFLSYISDTIFSIYWTWEYDGSFIDEDSLRPLCPECKRVLTETREWFDSMQRHNFLMGCPNCAFESDSFEGGAYDLQQRVLTEIRGRIQNEEYKK